jgi:hypothetical protein
MSMMRHGADLSSDRFEVEGWMCSQIVGAMGRQPGMKSCGSPTFLVAVLAGALERGERLTKVSMKASIFDWNNGGMLRY